MVITRTAPPLAPAREAGPSWLTASHLRNSSAARDKPSFPSRISSSMKRIAASTFASTARPSGPCASSRAIQPDSRTTANNTSAIRQVLERSAARSSTSRARQSCAEGVQASINSKEKKPASMPRLAGAGCVCCIFVASASKSSALMRNMSPVSTAKSPFSVSCGLAKKSIRAAICNTSSRDEKVEPPLTTQSRPTALSASR